MLRSVRALLLAATALTGFAALPSVAEETPPAAAVAVNDAIWNLGDLYATPEDWTKDYERLKGDMGSAGACKDTLLKDAGTMLVCLETISRIQKETLKLYVYAFLKSDENLGIAENIERKTQAQTLLVQLGAQTSWLNPAILAAGKAKIDEFRTAEPKLNDVFGFMLDNILRAEAHTLSSESEAVLAESADVLSRASTTYDILADAELPFPTIKLSTGEDVRIDQASYAKYRQAANRDDRKAVFNAFWGKWKEYEGTLGANLAAHVAGHIFNAKTRHYKNALEAALFPDNMPETVYRTLVSQVNENLPSLHRYFKLRKRMLGITDDMGYYDIYPALVQLDKKFSVEDSKTTTLAALAPLGDEYLDILKQGFAGHWAHVYPQHGKASGAYMMGAAYDVHPYLLLNHNDDYDSMSTWAHEWGHAVHTVLTSRNQPFEKSDYSTFTAETASIMNEMLLEDYMVKNAASKEEKLYYLGMALESIRGTFFRQTMFAEFELKIHEEAEAGNPLSGKRMSEMYCDLLKRYHGDAEGVVKIDPTYCIEWAYIPHFYRNFYVYQYATSITGAALLAQRIETGDPKERDTFLNLLKAGGSDYPYELYKKAGIDMASPEPYKALITRMNAIMDEMETLLAQP
ncbi:MAG: oligoendopeptidase F [Alphaproteobacteria bacterium]|nr:oligoendopeptidase F [Alphaproteobacteria bacterium]